MHWELLDKRLTTRRPGAANLPDEGLRAMKFIIRTEVTVPTVGKFNHEHMQEFADDSNEFGRVLEYREYIHRMFPERNYKLIEAKEVKQA